MVKHALFEMIDVSINNAVSMQRPVINGLCHVL